jgi:hypothetical protein
MAEAVHAGPNASIQLGGVLAAGTVIAASTSPFVRAYIGNAGKVQVECTSALFSTTATHKFNLYGVIGDARINGDGGIRTSAPLASATIVSTFTTLSAVTWPYQFVDVEVAVGASSTVTIAGRVLLGTAGKST